MIHVQIFRAACNGRITETINAGKRGKTCRQIRFSGLDNAHIWGRPDDFALTVAAHTRGVIAFLGRAAADPDYTFDIVEAGLCVLIDAARAAGIGREMLEYSEGSIRGIDAPVPLLTAQGDGWHARADDRGISLSDDSDRHNEPAMITTRQTHNQAYRLAAKVWQRVQAAVSFHQAGEILTAAGCRLHYYCRMD